MITFFDKKIRIKYLLNRKEDKNFDRKSSRASMDTIIRTAISFANAEGGTILIGVEDDGTFTGFKNCPDKLEEFKNIKMNRFSDSSIHIVCEELIVEEENDFLLALHIDPSFERIIHNDKKEVFLRVGDQSKKLDYNQIKSLEYEKNIKPFEKEILAESSLEDIDEELVKFYKDKNDFQENTSTIEILKNRGLLVDGKLTNAGALLFSKDPTKFLPQARIKFIRYDGLEMKVGQELNIIKEKTFTGPIFKIVKDAKDFIETQFREFQFIDQKGEFLKVPEYPEFAWLEGIVNAVTHRNYAIQGDYIKILMFNDRLEIHSPGKLPGHITTHNIKEERLSRNIFISRILNEMGLVKEMNEGVKRIFQEMRSIFLPDPTYIEKEKSLILILKNNILVRSNRNFEFLESLLGDLKELEEIDKRIIYITYNFKQINAQKLANLTNLSRKTITKRTKHLCEKKLLKWVGTSQNDPKQYYEIYSEVPSKFRVSSE